MTKTAETPGWFVRHGISGPPDRVLASGVMHWLVSEGPPFACCAVYVPAQHAPAAHLDFYHTHEVSTTMHVVLSGSAYWYVAGTKHEVSAGSIMLQEPGVPHTMLPKQSDHVLFLNIQAPDFVHTRSEWRLVPEAGLVDAPGDIDAFRKKWGHITSWQDFDPAIYQSERWLKAMKGGRGGQ